jgi:hypothetical protein
MILPQDFDFTQGKLQDYVDCPYRFYLRYIMRTKWPALVVDDATEFELRIQAGARFHRLIQQYLVGIPEARISEMADEDPHPDLRTWWESFLTYVPPWLDGQPYVETTLTTSLAGQRLVAKYDLILVMPSRALRSEDSRLIIFDWKTSQKAPRVDWLLDRLQTQLYCLVLADASPLFLNVQAIEPGQITMNYWFTSQPAIPVTLPYSRAAYSRGQAHLGQLIDQITTSEPGSFHRTSDLKQCRFCVYRSHCDRGIEAGHLAEFALTGRFAEDFDGDPGEVEMEIDFDDIPEIKF